MVPTDSSSYMLIASAVFTSSPPKGYVYLLFESEKSVKSLLANCTHDCSNGGDWYYKISSRRMRCKEVCILLLCISSLMVNADKLLT